MDSISRPEFGKIFERTCVSIDLQGSLSAAAIENRLKIARHMAKNKAKAAKTASGRRLYGFKAEELDKLVEHDFAGRTIREARTNPKGFVALTLLHGREEARQRILAQKRARLRWELAERVPRESRIPHRPETKRIPTHRRHSSRSWWTT